MSWSTRYGADNAAKADYPIPETPAHAAYLNNGSARLRILSGDPFRSSVILHGGEALRLSSARWMESHLKHISPELPGQLLDQLHNTPSSFERLEGLSTSTEGICYRYRDQKHCIVLDLHPDKTGKFFLASVTFPHRVYRNPALSSPLIRSELQQGNLALSEATLMHIRKYVYKPNFKSSNKYSAKRNFDYETMRVNNARKEMAEVYALPREKWEWAAYHTARGHNCFTLVLAAHFFTSLLKGQARLVNIDESHSFLAVGEVPEDLPVNMKEWPQDLAACDPWANISCLARDYPDEFKNKMEKWTGDGKRIVDNSALISPTAPAWIQKVLEGKKIAL